MECLRFGSSIPGSYWGCCAVDVFQNFKVHPDAKASIELIVGDSGQPVPGGKFFGTTWREIFWSRIREGTFGTHDMPNHGFIAILTDWQLADPDTGGAWLPILKEAGFEFIRTVSNSVYDGPRLGKHGDRSSHPNHVFGLFRNIGAGAIEDPFTPPKEWLALKGCIPEVYIDITKSGYSRKLAEAQRAFHRESWNKIGPAKRYTEAEIVAAGAPVILGGRRALRSSGVCSVGYPAEEKSKRETGSVAGQAGAEVKSSSAAFPVKAA